MKKFPVYFQTYCTFYITKKQECFFKNVIFFAGGETTMASNNSNIKAVPEAMDALEKFKYEVASEVGVTLKDGYNGNISAKDAGKIGGNMVRKMIQQAENNMIGK